MSHDLMYDVIVSGEHRMVDDGIFADEDYRVVTHQVRIPVTTIDQSQLDTAMSATVLWARCIAAMYIDEDITEKRWLDRNVESIARLRPDIASSHGLLRFVINTRLGWPSYTISVVPHGGERSVLSVTYHSETGEVVR